MSQNETIADSATREDFYGRIGVSEPSAKKFCAGELPELRKFTAMTALLSGLEDLEFHQGAILTTERDIWSLKDFKLSPSLGKLLAHYSPLAIRNAGKNNCKSQDSQGGKRCNTCIRVISDFEYPPAKSSIPYYHGRFSTNLLAAR